jgi:hypothetical protein
VQELFYIVLEQDGEIKMKKLVDFIKEKYEKHKQDNIKKENDKLEQLHRYKDSLGTKKKLLIELAKTHEEIAREELEIKDLQHKIKMSSGLVKTMTVFGDVLKKTDAALSENIKVEPIVVKVEEPAKPVVGLKVEDVTLQVKTKKSNRKVI